MKRIFGGALMSMALCGPAFAHDWVLIRGRDLSCHDTSGMTNGLQSPLTAYENLQRANDNASIKIVSRRNGKPFVVEVTYTYQHKPQVLMFLRNDDGYGMRACLAKIKRAFDTEDLK